MSPEGWPLALFWAMVIVVALQVVLLFIQLPIWLTSLFQQPISGRFDIASVLLTAWQVLAAVIGLTFVIVVFLTQFVHERAFERRAFPLFVTHTWMIFTVILGLLTLISMGIAALLMNNPAINQDRIPTIAFYNFLLFSANILLTIRLYIRTYQLVNPKRFRSIFLKYSRKQVSRSVEIELLRRFAEQLVFERCRALNIDLTYWYADHESDITSVKLTNLTSESVKIADVNIGLLALAHNRTKTLLGQGKTSRLELIGPSWNRLSADRPEIAFIPSAANRPQVVRLLQKAIRVQSMFEDVVTEDDLQLNRDLISDEIKAGRANGVAELLDQYLETLRSFLEAIEAHGLRYSPQEAKKEESFFSGWEIVTKIQRHYYSLAEQALQSSDHDILYHFVSLPWKAMSLSLQLRDHLVFQRFADAHIYLYATARRVVPSDERRQYVYEHSWRHLVDFYLYQIRPRLEHPEIEQSYAQTLGDYANYLILVLNRLLKLSIDYQDLEQFRNFAGTLRQMGVWLGNSPIHEIENLQLRLEFAGDAAVRHHIEEDIARKRIVADQLLRIRRSRGICFLGLGGWLMHLVDAGTLSADAFKEFIHIVNPEFADIEVLTALYSRVLSNSDIGDPFEWDHWEMNEQPESYGAVSVHWVQSSNWVMKYYVYRALELSPLNLDSIPELAATSVSERLAEIADTCISDFIASKVWHGYLEPISKPHTYANR